MSGEGQGEVSGEPSPQLWAVTVAGSGCSLGAGRKPLCLGGECGRRGPLQMAQPLAPSHWHSLASLRGLRRRGGAKQIVCCQAPPVASFRRVLSHPGVLAGPPSRLNPEEHGGEPTGRRDPSSEQAGTYPGGSRHRLVLDSMRGSCAQPLLRVPPSLRTLGGPGCVGQGLLTLSSPDISPA